MIRIVTKARLERLQGYALEVCELEDKVESLEDDLQVATLERDLAQDEVDELEERVASLTALIHKAGFDIETRPEVPARPAYEVLRVADTPRVSGHDKKGAKGRK